MSVPLLTTKLYIPPLRPQVVRRPRLVARLNGGLDRKLSLISAPAGFGKTTLLSEWITVEFGRDGHNQPEVRFAWLSLDEGDNDPARFLAYLVAALQTIYPDIGQAVLPALQSPQPPPVESLLTAVINDIATIPQSPSSRLVLVLDDYHAIEARAVDKATAFLLEHLPPQLHLAIASRIDPTLPLSRLRAGGQMTEVRENDLRFTNDQVATFLSMVMDLDLGIDDVAALWTRTEGWIAGLQLAGLALKGTQAAQDPRRDDEIADLIKSFTGSHRYIQDYLADEVLQQQPQSTKDFLLRTSILGRLSGPLCDAVCFGGNSVAVQANSQTVLEGLEAANLFIVPLDNERRWYRYHHLFADLLRQRLQHQQPEEVDELHIRASIWYEENNLEIEALHHAAIANDFERAARLVEGDGDPLYHRGAVAPVLAWLESLQASQLDAKPSLWVMYAEVLMTRGRPARAEEAYQAAEAALQDVEQDAFTRDLLGRIANGRASLAGFQYQPERMISLASRALELLHPDNMAIRAAASLSLGYAYQLQGDRAAASQALAEAIASSQTAGHIIVTIFAIMCLGDIQAAENRLLQAAQTYRRALELAGEQPIPFTGEAHLGLARLYYEWNELGAAQQHGQKSIQLTRQIEHTDKSVACEVFLARLKLARGDVAGAVAMLDSTSQSVQQHHFASCMPEVAGTQVLALLRRGDLAAAAHIAQTHELPISQARVHLAQGQAAEALAALDPVRRQAEARGWQDKILKIKVLQAVALHADGEKDKAVQLLGDALALAEPDGFIRTFVDEGAPMVELLYQAALQGIRPHYSAKLLAAIEDATQHEQRKTKPPPPSSVHRPLTLVEPLSQRELEVLQLVAQGLSNREISERLFLALSTIKGHNHSVFGKLQVQRRTEAIARARELGLL